MKNSLIYHHHSDTRLIGILNFQVGGIAEVKILSPYLGFVVQEYLENNDSEAGENDQKKIREILEQSFRICSKLQTEHHQVKKDFITLLETLDNFNNKNPEDYLRNRNELMKVFMNRFFDSEFGLNRNYESIRDSVFEFLGNYFLKFGKCAELNIKSEFKTDVQPPPFKDLLALLNEYLNKSEEQRMELIALQILTEEPGKYGWFLQQEFLTETDTKYEPQ